MDGAGREGRWHGLKKAQQSYLCFLFVFFMAFWTASLAYILQGLCGKARRLQPNRDEIVPCKGCILPISDPNIYTTPVKRVANSGQTSKDIYPISSRVWQLVSFPCRTSHTSPRMARRFPTQPCGVISLPSNLRPTLTAPPAEMTSTSIISALFSSLARSFVVSPSSCTYFYCFVHRHCS